MSNNKQSSVEWLAIKLWEEMYMKGDGAVFNELLEQAKAMHKSEIVWAHGIKMKGVNNHKCVSGEQYYNETYSDESNN